jgi:hypothetical protein
MFGYWASLDSYVTARIGRGSASLTHRPASAEAADYQPSTNRVATTIVSTTEATIMSYGGKEHEPRRWPAASSAIWSRPSIAALLHAR